MSLLSQCAQFDKLRCKPKGWGCAFCPGQLCRGSVTGAGSPKSNLKQEDVIVAHLDLLCLALQMESGGIAAQRAELGH